MPRGFSGLTVIRNKETSKVFFAIVRNEKTAFPTDIAKALNKSYATIRGHMARLEKIEVLAMVQEEGKYRHYAIDWNKFCNVAMVKFKSSNSLTSHVINCPVISKENRPKQKEVDNIFTILKKGSFFPSLIKNYFFNLSQKELLTPDSIDEALDEFEADIKDNLQKIIPEKKTKNKEQAQAIKLWGEYMKKHDDAYNKVFEDAWEMMK